MANVRLGLGSDPVEVQFRKRPWLKSTEPPAHLWPGVPKQEARANQTLLV